MIHCAVRGLRKLLWPLMGSITILTILKECYTSYISFVNGMRHRTTTNLLNLHAVSF